MGQLDETVERMARAAQEPSSPEPLRGTDRVVNRAVDWELAHTQLLRLARRRAGLDLEEGTSLLAAFRAGAHVRLGYGSFAEYIERVLGYAPRLTHEKLRVAEALETLTALPRALRDATLNWSAVRELTRVVTPQTESEWLAAARGRTARDVERLVAGHRPGSRPQDPAEPDARRHVLRFEVSATTLATFRDAAAQIRRDAGGHLDDDAVLLHLARHLLGGSKDAGRASYQVAVSVCEDCQRARQHSHGELIDIDAAAVAMAHCDAQHVPEGLAPIDASGGRPAADELARPELAVDPGEAATSPPRRATQDVPPATRRLVMRRDRSRCSVPGCRHCTFLDVHHIVARAAGGSHDPDNLIVLCGAHHRAVHLGTLIIVGSVSAGLRFLHADGRPYGEIQVPQAEVRPTEADGGDDRSLDADTGAISSPEDAKNLENTGPAPAQSREPASPDTVRLRSATLRALRRLGFGERESRAALERAATHVGQEPTLEALIRAALLALVGDLPKAS